MWRDPRARTSVCALCCGSTTTCRACGTSSRRTAGKKMMKRTLPLWQSCPLRPTCAQARPALLRAPPTRTPNPPIRRWRCADGAARALMRHACALPAASPPLAHGFSTAPPRQAAPSLGLCHLPPVTHPSRYGGATHAAAAAPPPARALAESGDRLLGLADQAHCCRPVAREVVLVFHRLLFSRSKLWPVGIVALAARYSRERAGHAPTGPGWEATETSRPAAACAGAGGERAWGSAARLARS